MPDRLRPYGRPYDPRCSDKVVQGYLPDYLVIASVIGPEARVLELGVDQGESMALWAHLFPLGKVVGVDDNPSRAAAPAGMQVVLSDQANPQLPELVGGGQWDLIVDDASHDADLTARSFALLWPFVRPGGFYTIEDWYCSPEMTRMVGEKIGLLDWREHGVHCADEVSFRFGLCIIRKVA